MIDHSNPLEFGRLIFAFKSSKMHLVCAHTSERMANSSYSALSCVGKWKVKTHWHDLIKDDPFYEIQFSLFINLCKRLNKFDNFAMFCAHFIAQNKVAAPIIFDRSNLKSQLRAPIVSNDIQLTHLKELMHRCSV